MAPFVSKTLSVKKLRQVVFTPKFCTRQAVSRDNGWQNWATDRGYEVEDGGYGLTPKGALRLRFISVGLNTDGVANTHHVLWRSQDLGG